MKFGSVCSGIEAASVAWPFWEAAWFSEIEPFPCAVLKHHYPDVPNHGDMTALPDRILSGEVEAPDVFCGGTPCQAFSVAGNRKSLDDARGNLSLTFCEIADAIDSVRYVRNEQPTIIFWENVPGVLNTTDNAFGCFLAKLAGESCELQPPGGRWSDSGCVHGPKRTIAWRILDAQYFGLAQRRRRVFVVASSRKGFNPSEILFEFSGERRDTAPSRKTGQGITADAESGFKLHETVGTLCADTHPGSYSGQDAYTGRLIPVIPEPMCFEPRSPDGHARVIGNIAPCLNTMGGGQREPCVAMPSPPHAFKIRGGCEGGGKGYLGQDEQAFTILTGNDQQVAVPYQDVVGALCARDYKGVGNQYVGEDKCVVEQAAVAFHAEAQADQLPTANRDTTISDSLTCSQHAAVATQYAVRRLTPTECERLQGFPPIIETIRILGCLDHQSKTALAEVQCHRLQSSAWNVAESEYLKSAQTVQSSLKQPQAKSGWHVVLYVHSRLEGGVRVLLKKTSESPSNVSNAENHEWLQDHTLKESIAAFLVPLLGSREKIATNGKEASLQPISLSLAEESGNKNAVKYGAEIEGIVRGATKDASAEKFTTSHHGQDTQALDSQTKTLLCSVINAISSCIPSETQSQNFCIDLAIERDYTNIPWRKKPEAPDGPRYRALGNSWAVPVVRWIGERINNQQGNTNE